MFKPIALSIIAVLVVVIGAVLAYAATKPDTFRVQRSAGIKAPPERIFALIEDFRRWELWSPYEKLDPQAKKTFSGSASGEGAVYEWDGNSQAGKGRIEITSASPPTKLALSLEMFKPFACRNVVEFTLEPSGDATEVTWAMQGSSSYVSKLMCVFMDMDKMVGGQFEEGLANLKTVAEKDAAETDGGARQAATERMVR